MILLPLVLCYGACELMILLFILSAIATVVTVAEILKNNGLAIEKSKIAVALFVISSLQFSSF